MLNNLRPMKNSKALATITDRCTRRNPCGDCVGCLVEVVINMYPAKATTDNYPDFEMSWMLS